MYYCIQGVVTYTGDAGFNVLELCLFDNLFLGISSRFAKMIKLKFAWLFGVKLSFDPAPISCSSVIDKK